MRRFSLIMAFAVVMAAAQVVGIETIAFAQGPSLGRPGAINGGFGSPGAMQPPMGSRTTSARSFGRGRSPAVNGSNDFQNQGSGRVNYMGAMGRKQNVMDRAGPRSSQQLRQEAKQVQGPLTNFSF